MMRTIVVLAALANLAVAETRAADLLIQVHGVQPGAGFVYAAACATGFAESDCPYKDRQAATAAVVELRIQDLRPGEYAVAAFQDLNGNGHLDRPFFIPTEPFGFSNGIGRRGMPSFEAAKIGVHGPATTVVVQLR